LLSFQSKFQAEYVRAGSIELALKLFKQHLLISTQLSFCVQAKQTLDALKFTISRKGGIFHSQEQFKNRDFHRN
jgi:hypothetical protein